MDQTPETRIALILEPFFTLWYYGGMSWEEYYRFPVPYKRWLIERIHKEITKAAEAGNDIVSKGAHHNDPQTRALLGKVKHHGSHGPRQRFT